MVSLEIKKLLRPVAHKQQIKVNQKLKSEGRQAVGMKEDERWPSRAKRFALFHYC